MSDRMSGQDAAFDHAPQYADTRGGNGAVVCYALMLATLFTAFATGLVAVIIAYVSRERDGHWTNSHYTFIIRTFWISILYTILTGCVALFIGWVPLIGWAIVGIMSLYTVAWFIGRNVIGILRALNERPIDDPQSWMFG
ncbi:hypothetical protein [Thalassospira sp.]|uniref:DUF4870 family protein n=1 Tax=Thalassospira sp. TaxID=1912094 RepID=UPI0027332530|nr:hypothetical protein [Thalassospira sp.]MDP2699690.1 hypothetical protein [Thalassospira sp.]